MRDASSITNNVVRFASRVGIHAGDGVAITEVPEGIPDDHIIVEGSVVENNGIGIRVLRGARVARNVIAGSAGEGIIAVGAVISENVVRENGAVGISCSDAIVRDNQVSENVGSGIFGSGSFRTNNVSGNQGGDILAGGSIQSNRVAGNQGVGMSALTALVE